MKCHALLQIVDGSFDAALVTDLKGNVVHMNTAARVLLEWEDSDKVNGMSSAQFLSFPDVEDGMRIGATASRCIGSDTWEIVTRGIEREPIEREALGVKKDGARFEVAIKVIQFGGCSCCAGESSTATPSHNGTEFGKMPQSQKNNSTLFPSPSVVAPPLYHCAYIRRDPTSHRRAQALEKEVRRLTRTQSALIKASTNSVIIVDQEGIIKKVDAATLDEFGYERDELVGRNMSMLISEVRKYGPYIRRYAKTDVQREYGKRKELKAKRKDGTTFPIEIGVTEIETDKGEERLFAGMLCNITSKNEAHDKLRRSEHIGRSVLDASFDAIFTINEKGTILMVNNSAERQFGWSHEDFIGQNISMICGGGHAKNHDKYLQRYLETGERRVMGKKRELHARRKDGSQFIIELGLSEVKTQAGEERMFCGYVRDLTRRKEQEMELLRKECLTTGIIEAAFDPMFSINEDGEIMMVNEAAVSQFGWTRDEFIGSNISMICGGGHGKRHDQYLKRYARTGEKRVMGIRRELPARRKDGSEFTIELGIAEIRTLGNDKQSYCGFVRDLTRQKEDQHELAHKRNFMREVIEASFDALFVIDEDAIIQMVNEASCQKFGWTREEFMGQNIKMITGDQYRDKHDEYIRRYLETGIKKVMGTQRELVARRKDNSTFPINLGLSEVDSNGDKRMFAAFIRDLTDQKRFTAMEIEKAASEVLLLNMLPESIALRLKEDPSHVADQFANATILFADIVGFTQLSSMMEPAASVSMLNDLFGMFDNLVDRYGLNKVKTIGDCYMVTSVPETKESTHDCIRVCHFALDLFESLQTFNKKNPEHKLNLRIGINTGPVVAGVVGTKRFLYDLWGDAVNLASRMESTGIPGKIQVTKHVMEIVRASFYLRLRGMVYIKGKGDIETYFLLDRRDFNKSTMYRPALRRGTVGSKQEAERYTLLDSVKILQKSITTDAALEVQFAALRGDFEKGERGKEDSENV